MPVLRKPDTTIVGEWEHAASLIANEEAAPETGAFARLVTAQGPKRLFGVDLTPEEQAARWLATWFVYVQADPLISIPWLSKFVDDISKEMEVQCAARDMQDYSIRMRALFPRYWHLAILGMDLTTQRDYLIFRLSGLHDGRVRPNAMEKGAKAA